ncbi:twin-arginine translocase TatA/TatE family subunit [Siminovitchia sp. 179-K 8D1 HS]|uniref:twin-arginine translocase TatA/TatE family subunit n=1 Tax=Siminovitchia sp. 179-K 8D1 HS TaxID=3142385 RepID=UPI0039A2DCB3
MIDSFTLKGNVFYETGVGSLIFIGIVALLIFGPNKSPEPGKAANTTRERKGEGNG